METSLGTVRTSLFWVRLEFPGTPLAPLPSVAVARLPLPPSLASFHGLPGRDILARWEHLLYQGLCGRLSVRDQPSAPRRWIARWL
ncbi:MAG TPA: hypothetical protein VFA26_17815 [Gemmataceae bacterium]|nr:hypothetical protein [Gemmataceae bacterium]